MTTTRTYGPRVTKALRSVESARKALAEAATDLPTDIVSYDRLAGLALSVAEAEGRMLAAHIADTWAEEPTRMVEAFTDRLLSGADDTWSGRGNEAKRAHFDGFREAARRYMDDARFDNKAV